MGETADGIGDILTGSVVAGALDGVHGNGAYGGGRGAHDGAGGT